MKYRERNYKERQDYCRSLRTIIGQRGLTDIVYMDESGFEATVCRLSGWSRRGKKVHGDRSGKRYARTNLLAAKRGKTLLAPVLYSGTTTAEWFNHWLEHHLMQELRPGSTLIMDNARFHRKQDIERIAKKSGHYVLFLPPYSPDFNPIEEDFAVMKKRRMYAPEETSIDQIVKAYG